MYVCMVADLVDPISLRFIEFGASSNDVLMNKAKRCESGPEIIFQKQFIIQY